MSIYQKLSHLSAALVGAKVGQFIAPIFIAPVTRAATSTFMNMAFGKPVGIFSAFARKIAVEHAGHQAFIYAGPIGSTIGGIATVAAVQGVSTLFSYGNHLKKNRDFLGGVKAAENFKSNNELLSFEMNKEEGFKLT